MAIPKIEGIATPVCALVRDDMESLYIHFKGENQSMKQQLEAIKLRALEALDAAETPAALDEQRVKWLGKKGELTNLLKMMGKLSPEERPVMGQLANDVRAEIESKLEERKTAIDAAVLEARLVA